MTLTVDAPHPPDLTVDVGQGENQGSPAIEHRSDLEAMLHDGAWKEGFAEWAENTDLTEFEWSIVLDLGLVDDYDFQWDNETEQVVFDAPAIPQDWRERELHPDLGDWATVSAINDGLDQLGRTVADLLELEYVDWGTEEPTDQDLE